MEEKDTSRTEDARDVVRVDDRNEELDESPGPDPMAKDTTAADDPQAD